MLSTLSAVVSSLFPTISGKFFQVNKDMKHILIICRLLDKIAKDIMVCEHKTVRRWDGSIGAYKKHLAKKMFASGAI
jgi:pantothenate synthetase